MLNLFDVLLLRKFGGGGGSSITVEPLTVTANGTQTAPSGKAFSPVTVNVKPETLFVVEDKLNSLTSNISSDMFYRLRTNLPMFGDLSAQLTAAVRYSFMGNPVLLNLFNYGSYNNENVIAGMAFDTDGSLNGTVGAVLLWSANSGLIRADVLMNGQVQDLLSYASQIDAVLVVSGVDS